ncbi:MAG: peptidylprolyl isomerase [Bacteroidales bacterium]|nr:peptidylprolyl isomerase [Bacteroidales bacterium]
MALCFSGCKNRQTDNTNQEQQEAVTEETQQQEQVKAAEPVVEEPVFKITTSLGDLTVKLYKETPLHRDNFVKLAKSGFYTGILFHRIIKGFMIQTGDPFTKDPSKKPEMYGSGGPGYTIPAEIVAGKTHKKGAICAARRGDSVNPNKESSGSQFYIVQDADGCKHLDGEYTVFGETIDGFDVIDKIANIPTNNKDFPNQAIAILAIKEIKQPAVDTEKK